MATQSVEFCFIQAPNWYQERFDLLGERRMTWVGCVLSVCVREKARQALPRGFDFPRESDTRQFGTSLSHRSLESVQREKAILLTQLSVSAACPHHGLNAFWLNGMVPVGHLPYDDPGNRMCMDDANAALALGKQHKAYAYLVRVGLHIIFLNR